MVFSVFVALGAAHIGQGPWPGIWLAATLLAQGVNLRVIEPFRRDPDFRMTPRREFAFHLSLCLSAAVFAACGPLLWFGSSPSARVLAVIVLAGGAVNVALQAHASAKQLWFGCGPFMLVLQALPLISLVTATGPERGVMAVTAFGTTLIVLHFAASGLHGVESARRIKNALEEARRERERAEAASAAKSDFLGVMSHELRTPLNGVLGMAQAMAAEELTDSQRERLDVVRWSGELLLVLLNDLLDISKIETASLELEAKVFDLTALAAQAQAVFAPLAEAKGLSFELELLPSAGEARVGDLDRARQILHKLISNAVKFTDVGVVSVTIGGDPDELVFEVADTGPGVAPEHMGLLFERFGRGDLSITRRHGGSGLGLAIARGLARLMGGDVTVRSAPGEGAVFTASLRLARAEAPALELGAAPQPQVAAGGRLRVLAAEDNPTNQLVLRTLLEQVGLSVHIVDDGQAAVAAWRTQAWDLVLMDIQMPVMDGLEATRAIRALEQAEGRPRTPIVAVTANATDRQAAEYRAAGMDGLTPKPIQFAQLAAAINDAFATAAAAPDRPLAAASTGA